MARDYLYAELQNRLFNIDYKGLESATTITDIDGEERTIKVRVKRVPQELKVINKIDNTEFIFDGSVDQEIVLSDYQIVKIDNEDYAAQYSLTRNGELVGELISIPKDKSISNVELLFNENNEPYLHISINNEESSIDCSLKAFKDADDHLLLTLNNEITRSINKDNELQEQVDALKERDTHFVTLDSEQEITAEKTFVHLPKMISDVIPTDDKHFITKKYLDDNKLIAGEAITIEDKIISSKRITHITYSELKTLRDNSQLIAGQQYRITDYQTTTCQEDTISAGHQFDIIVVADSVNTLNENAKATLHQGDTYFINSNLEAWELKYSLDNDVTRFDWADVTNGKGVIYYMKDEHNNELPYDFKNIIFKGSSIYRFDKHGFGTEDVTSDNAIEVDEYYYTFSASPDGIMDFSTKCNAGGYVTCYNNKILPAKDIERGVQFLNKIVFLGENCHSNTFEENCYDSTFGEGCCENTFGNNCYNISFRPDCIRNTFANNCHTNTFGKECHLNVFKNSCYGNTFSKDCDDNIFGNCCFENIFSYTCHRNSFGNMCRYNNFDHHCVDNRFGNHCNSNTFGYECRKNDFGNNCNENIFGNNCVGNKFGNECGNYDKDNEAITGNTFGNDCEHNVFENNCHSNKFGNECKANYFQNITRRSNFANKCCYNTLLTICSDITLGYESIYNHFNSRSQYITLGKYAQHNAFGIYCTNITIEDYSRYNIIESGVKYINLISTNPTSTNRIQYYTIEQANSGTETQYNDITVVRNRTYKTTVKNNKSIVEGNIKINGTPTEDNDLTTKKYVDDVKKSLTKADVGLDKVNNVAITDEEVSQIHTNKNDIVTLNTKVDNNKTNLEKALETKADLVDGIIPSSQLPSYVDDVIEIEKMVDGKQWKEEALATANGTIVFNNTTASNLEGGTANEYYHVLLHNIDGTEANLKIIQPEAGKIYVLKTSGVTFRWGGTNLVEISKSLALGETTSTAYAGNKGKANAEAIANIQLDLIDINQSLTDTNTEISDLKTYLENNIKVLDVYTNEELFCIACCQDYIDTNKKKNIYLGKIETESISNVVLGLVGEETDTIKVTLTGNSSSQTKVYNYNTKTFESASVTDQQMNTLKNDFYRDLDNISNAHLNSISKQFAVGYSDTNISAVSNSNWIKEESLSSCNVRSITYGNNYWLAVGTSGVSAYSENGKNWTSINISEGALTGCAYGNGKFITVVYDTSTVYVADLSPKNIWKEAAVFKNKLEGIRFINDRFFAVGEKGFLAYSIDGVTWYEVTSITDTNIIDITYGNGKYVAVGMNGLVIYSINGKDWFDTSSEDFTVNYRHVIFGNNIFVAGCQYGKVRYSYDGITWNDGIAPEGATESGWIRGFAYSNNRFILVRYAGSGEVWSSEDGINWKLEYSADNMLWSIYENDGLFVVGGGNGSIYTLDLEINWQDKEPKNVEHLYYRLILNKNNGNRLVSETYYEDRSYIKNYINQQISESIIAALTADYEIGG